MLGTGNDASARAIERVVRTRLGGPRRVEEWNEAVDESVQATTTLFGRPTTKLLCVADRPRRGRPLANAPAALTTRGVEGERSSRRARRPTGMGLRRDHGPARRLALSCYYRVASNRRLAVRTLACVVALILASATLTPWLLGLVTRLQGVRVGPPILRDCGANKYGFVPAGMCHPFTLPRTMSRLDVRPKACGKLSSPRAGFCLCDDDDTTTTIAAPKGCGTKPVFCEKECASSPVVGRKPPPCEFQPRPECADRASRRAPARQMLDLIRAFSDARGPDLGVSLPKGTRRDLYQDFVMYDRRLSPGDAEKARRRVETFKRDAPPYPGPSVYAGRGIVIVGGNAPKYQTSYWVAVHAIRRAGCELPVQLWFPAGEAPDCAHAEELRRMNVEIVSFADFQSAGGAAAEMTNRFMYKIVAMLFSPFEEVLMMDGDNIALRDPETLFDAEDYVRTGSLLWMDFWRGSSAPDCQVVLGNATKLPFTHESGQMLVHKRKIWDALGLALFMNSHSDFFYPLSIGYMGLGDKEIVAMSLLHLGLEYGLVSKGPDHVGVRDHDRAEVLGNTMMQHGPDGKPFFMHTNLGKPMGHVPATESTYVRRWQASMIHGKNFPGVLSEASGVEDFEMWYYRLLRDKRCWFDDRPPKHWYHTLGVGPFVEGFHISDHYNVNDDLEAFREMKQMGILFG